MSLVNDYLKRLGRKSISPLNQSGGCVPPVLQKNRADSLQKIKSRKYLRFAGITIAIYLVAYSMVSVVTAFQISDDSKSSSPQNISVVADTTVLQPSENIVISEEPGAQKYNDQLIASAPNGTAIKPQKSIEPLVLTSVSSLAEGQSPDIVEEQSSKNETIKQVEGKKIITKDTKYKTDEYALKSISVDKAGIPEIDEKVVNAIHEEPYPIVGMEIEGAGTNKQIGADVVSGKKILFKKSTNTPAYYYQIALQAQHESNFGRAERFYLNTLREEPDHENALVNLAAIYIKGKRLQEAEALLKKVAKLNPKNSKALVNAGMIELQKNETEAANDYFLKALQYNPTEETALINLAYLELQKKNYDEASVYYDKLIWISPDKINILLAYAGLEEKRQQYKSAIKLYTQCLGQLSTQKQLGQYDKIKGRIQILRQYIAKKQYNNSFGVKGAVSQ